MNSTMFLVQIYFFIIILVLPLVLYTYLKHQQIYLCLVIVWCLRVFCVQFEEKIIWNVVHKNWRNVF